MTTSDPLSRDFVKWYTNPDHWTWRELLLYPYGTIVLLSWGADPMPVALAITVLVWIYCAFVVASAQVRYVRSRTRVYGRNDIKWWR